MWGSVSGFAVFSSAVWWPVTPDLLYERIAVFWFIGAVCIWMMRYFHEPTGLDRSRTEKGVLLFALGLGVAAHVFTGPIASGQGIGTLWHHWGVYVGSAQLLVAGAVPFFDFPIQYGFGPTVTMALACRTDCWEGAYYVISVANLFYLLTLVFGTTLLIRGMATGLILTAAGAMISAVLLWTIYPPFLVSPLATPSTGGLRFLPLALLVVSIVFGEIHKEGSLPSRLWGYLFWSLSMLWSPEAAIFATMVWWPYLALRDIQSRNSRGLLPVARRMAVWLFVMLLATCLLAGAFSLLFWMAFGQMPDIDGYLIYILHPPGPMPANVGGPVWILLTTLALSVIAMFRADDRNMRLVMVCALSTLAVSTYYLGRSHDNNILNLFPFVLLSLVSSLRVSTPVFLVGYTKSIILGIILWPSFFGLDSFKQVAGSHDLGRLGSRHFLEMTSLSPSAWHPLDEVYGAIVPPSAEAAEALGVLTKLGEGSPVLINGNFILPRYDEFSAWTAMINPASYAVLPADAIQSFIERSRQHWNRVGWIVVQPEFQGDWLDLFESVYSISETRRFGNYEAYRLVPK